MSLTAIFSQSQILKRLLHSFDFLNPQAVHYQSDGNQHIWAVNEESNNFVNAIDQDVGKCSRRLIVADSDDSE